MPSVTPVAVSDLFSWPGNDDKCTEIAEDGKWNGKYLGSTVRRHHHKPSSVVPTYPSGDMTPVIPPKSNGA